jgi:hypothetical protein
MGPGNTQQDNLRNLIDMKYGIESFLLRAPNLTAIVRFKQKTNRVMIEVEKTKI